MSDTLRWSVDKSGCYIYDDQFHWDGMLRVSGDFATLAERMRYSQAIVDALNKASIPSE